MMIAASIPIWVATPMIAKIIGVFFSLSRPDAARGILIYLALCTKIQPIFLSILLLDKSRNPCYIIDTNKTPKGIDNYVDVRNDYARKGGTA